MCFHLARLMSSLSFEKLSCIYRDTFLLIDLWPLGGWLGYTDAEGKPVSNSD